MNWYKQMKLSQDYLMPDTETYLGIGHDEEYCESYLWLWANNQLHSIKVEPFSMEGNSVHEHGQWDLYNATSPTHLGRIERCEDSPPRGSISDQVSDQEYEKEIPSIITRSLYNKFGQDLELYRFK